MFFPVNLAQVYIAPGATDMRKSINGLSILVAEQLELDPLSGRSVSRLLHVPANVAGGRLAGSDWSALSWGILLEGLRLPHYAILYLCTSFFSLSSSKSSAFSNSNLL